ncbi:Ankyrin repeat and KH domain-containing protein mask [Gryllus bimaculatus]|nr:Ankyrin repeat and KH domain-containing protein mask [Gryllus bimaculatus]
MKMENLNMPWDYGADIADSVFHESLHNNQLPLTNARTLKDLMPARDLTLLDLYERERQLAAREAAAIRLEERGRQQEIAAREAALLGRETALAMKEREITFSEREQALHEFEIRLKDQEAQLNIAKHKQTELENEFYRKSQQENILANTREREIHEKEDALRRKDQELQAKERHLKEKENEIEEFQKMLKEMEETLKVNQDSLVIRERDVEIREKQLDERKRELQDNEKQNEINIETMRQEFESTKLSLEERALELKKKESSIKLHEQELDEKQLEIQRELEKQDEILKDTANIMAEKEEEFKNLERETMVRIEAQEEELKVWETELQQQEIKMQEHKQNLEKHKTDLLEREEVIEMHKQQLLQWQKQLQTRARSLNEQAEAQEEHLRVILEKEKIFDELKTTLEQKEQQYKMLVQCKEHEFDVREQNLQKIISELLNSETKKGNLLYSDITALSKRVSPVLFENYGHCAQPSEILENVSNHLPLKALGRKKQERDDLNDNFTNSAKCMKSQIERKSMNTLQNIQQKGRFPESTTKQSPQLSKKTYLTTTQIAPQTKNSCFPLQAVHDLTKEKNSVKEDSCSLRFEVPEFSRNNDFTLSKEQIQLLEQIKNNSFKKEDNISVPQSSMTFCNLQKENPKNLNIMENLKDGQRTKSVQFKNHFLSKNIQKKLSNTSHIKHNVYDNEFSGKYSSKASYDNEMVPSPSQIQTKSRSTSCEDLQEALDIDLNEQNTLHGATKGFRLEIVHSLVEQHGANIDGRDPDGRTALHWAAELGHLALVQYLGGDMGASVDAQCNSGYTALHLAALEGRLDVVQYLIETLGADTEARDTNGETALHLAAGAGWLEVVKYISSVKAFQATKTSPSLNVPKIEIEECL